MATTRPLTSNTVAAVVASTSRPSPAAVAGGQPSTGQVGVAGEDGRARSVRVTG